MNWIIGLIFALSFAWGLAFADAPVAKQPYTMAPPTVAGLPELSKRPHESVIFELGLFGCDGSYMGSLFVTEDGTAFYRTPAELNLQDAGAIAQKLESLYGKGHNGVFKYTCGKPQTGKGGPTTSI